MNELAKYNAKVEEKSLANLVDNAFIPQLRIGDKNSKVVSELGLIKFGQFYVTNLDPKKSRPVGKFDNTNPEKPGSVDIILGPYRLTALNIRNNSLEAISHDKNSDVFKKIQANIPNSTATDAYMIGLEHLVLLPDVDQLAVFYWKNKAMQYAPVNIEPGTPLTLFSNKLVAKKTGFVWFWCMEHTTRDAAVSEEQMQKLLQAAPAFANVTTNSVQYGQEV